MTIRPVILSGGSGTRLWPVSRLHYPKQLLPLVGKHTLLQSTVLRLRGLPDVNDKVIVVCNEEHRFLIAEQLREIGCEAEVLILEPEGRNTAPALTLAALALQNSDEPMLVMPADHVIENIPAFQHAVRRAVELAERDQVVTFGIVPNQPQTGYGYLKLGEQLTDSDQVYQLKGFVEKPDRATAQRYLDAGNFLWNSGMFMLKGQLWLSLLATFHPSILQTCQDAYTRGRHDQDFFRIDKAIFSRCVADSIDYAVMEKFVGSESGVGRAAVVALHAGWSDVGAWTALWDISDKDTSGNVVRGDTLPVACRDSMLISTHRLVASVGITDLMIIETADAVLVAHRDSVQDVKKVVDFLQKGSRDEYRSHQRVYRPWGSYERIDQGERYQVKRITVKPGAALSLQLHHQRAEHWVVVKGTAKVTRGQEIYLVAENQSTYIPIGVKHRLENPGSEPLEIIEIQSGNYLGEDDIVRLEDQYGRIEV